jgi:hypothetical protein
VNTHRRTPEGGWETEEARREREERRERNRNLFDVWYSGYRRAKAGLRLHPAPHLSEEETRALAEGFEAGERALAAELEEMGALYRP